MEIQTDTIIPVLKIVTFKIYSSRYEDEKIILLFQYFASRRNH